MTLTKKQIKITQLFRKVAQLPEDCDDLEQEIGQLEQTVKEKQNEWFQLHRNSFKCKRSSPKTKAEPFVRPQKIVLSNAIDRLKNNLELMSMLTGVEVTSYELGEHCCIVFHMQNDAGHILKHGLRIDMQAGSNVVSKSSLPIGFNINAVMDDFDNVMMPDCLDSIRRALVVYYDRLDQFEALKKMLKMEAQLFKLLDGSHMEITFIARSDMEPEAEEIELMLMLDYRVYDIRPKQYSFKEIDLPEGAAVALKEQCTVFKRKPLNKAFKEAFITGTGPYKLVQQMGAIEIGNVRKQKRFRPNKHNYNNDDTFQPEDCSDQSDDDVVEN